MALTVSITTEDVYTTWLHLLGEALQGLPARMADDAAALLRAVRRQAKRQPSRAVGALVSHRVLPSARTGAERASHAAAESDE